MGPEKEAATRARAGWAGLQLWSAAYRVELLLFVFSFVVLAAFSSQRFLRQSAAPHFVYQAKAWLEGRLDVDPQVLPNIEDWACVREVAGQKVRCVGQPQAQDTWYVSFPPFPAVAMLPFVALHGYQFNDTSFTVFWGALAVALFYSLLRMLSKRGELERDRAENIALSLLLAFGTLFFYCAIRGEVWFTAEVMGVALTCLYVRNAVGARKPLWAGLFYSMATLTRTPLLFAGLFFLLECFTPGPEDRWGQLRRLVGAAPEDVARRKAALARLGLFVAGAAPLAGLAAAYNLVRFGKLSEFGHRFFYNNRVNADIDHHGLFNLLYLPRNLEAAFLKLPSLQLNPLRLAYDPHGLTLLLTLPLLVFILIPKGARPLTPRLWGLLAAFLGGLALHAVLRGQGQQAFLVGLVALSVALFSLFAFFVLLPQAPRRLHWPLWLTVAVCALPGLYYQNTGYMQFGFRFSLDYTPYLLLLFAISGWSLRNRWVMGAAVLGVAVNFWGAAAFRGYTELVRGW